MSNKEKIMEIVETLLRVSEWDDYIDSLYEVVINEDYDYIENLFNDRDKFQEYIEKWKPNKCCVKEEDND